MLTVLCGGIGGVKLVDGLAAVLADPAELSVVVNTADDWDHLGLSISPDVDTVLYTLAGLASEDRGWGIEGDT
jgi:LPPG:FO 2-phospho-L-lactate transferase